LGIHFTDSRRDARAGRKPRRFQNEQSSIRLGGSGMRMYIIAAMRITVGELSK
jgi:hypothetical protein